MSTANLSHFRTRTRPQLLQEPITTAPHPSPLIRVLDAIEAERKRPVIVLIDSAERDWTWWQRAEVQVTGKTCRTCFGKGQVPAYRYAHVDDFIDCPVCTPPRPRRAIDPTEIDTNDVPF